MRPTQDRPLEGVRILIAEDSAIQALDLKALLENGGAEVIGPAKTVAKALALASSAPITCAILDVMLGKERVSPVAGMLARRGIGFVFYTGGAGLDELRREWPKAQVVTKPAPFEALLKAVQAACQVSSGC